MLGLDDGAAFIDAPTSAPIVAEIPADRTSDPRRPIGYTS